MAKTVTLQWKPFFEGKQEVKKEEIQGIILKSSITGAIISVLAPISSAATSDSAWWKLLEALWNMSDWFCVGVIIFAGASWMMGNRPQAITLITGGAIGYIIIRHALDIQKFLAGI